METKIDFCRLCPTSELSLNKVDQVIEVTSSMISGLPVQADFLLLNNTGITFRQLKVEKSCGCVSLRLPDMDFESKGTLPMTLSYRPKGEDFSQVIELLGVAEGGLRVRFGGLREREGFVESRGGVRSNR